MQIPQMLPEQSSRNLLQTGQVLPDQTTPQVCFLLLLAHQNADCKAIIIECCSIVY